MANLVIVVLWRENVGDPLKVFKFNNFCSDKQSNKLDAFYVRDVFDYYFGSDRNNPQFFKQFKTVYLSGDHGTHFSDIRTIFNETQFYHKYGVKLHNFFLCSYHAYNRCDGAGVESKRLALAATKERRGPADAEEYAELINESSHQNSYAFKFDQIDRNAELFQVDLVKGEKLHLRDRCEIKFAFEDSEGKPCVEEGVIFCRNIPTLHGTPDEMFDVYDLRKNPPGGALCKACSKKEQFPRRHKGKPCPIAGLHLYTDLKDELAQCTGPGKLHLTGVQMTREWITQNNKV